jgi:hypothetical protein
MTEQRWNDEGKLQTYSHFDLLKINLENAIVALNNAIENANKAGMRTIEAQLWYQRNRLEFERDNMMTA